MKTFRYFLFLGMTCAAFKGTAQQLPLGSQYFMNPFILNPAYTGFGDDIRIFLSHRSQYTSIAGSPQTSSITIDAPTSVKGVGLGLNLYSDVTSILSRNAAMANYSYRLRFGKSHQLIFGLAAGIMDNTINYQQAVARDLDDPSIFQQKMHRTVFSADLGILYKLNQLEVGFAVPQILGNMTKIRQNNGTAGYFDMQQHFQGMVKYTLDVNTARGITAYPMVMVRAVQGAPFQYDLNLVADWKKIGWAAISYHSNFAFGVNIGVRYKQFLVGYSRDIGISKIRRYDGHTNEFLLSYQFGNDNRKRLDQHDKELEELRRQTMQQTEEIQHVQQEVKDLTHTDIALADSLQLLRAAMDSLQAKLHQTAQQQLPVSEPKTIQVSSPTPVVSVKEQFRTYSSQDFLDENGQPLPAGYYVVIGSFGVKDNALRFRTNRLEAGEVTARIAYNASIRIHNVFVLYTQDYDAAHAERLNQLSTYDNTWVLKLE